MILIKLRPLPGGMIEVSPSGFDPAVRDQFRGVPGALWDREARAYVAPAEALDGVLTTLEKARVARIDRSALRDPPTATRAIASYRKLPGELRGYQTEGVQFLRTVLPQFGAAVLADEMGLGKTVQAILATKPGQRTIVVCPAVVAGHWADEIERWAGEEALVWTGKKKPKGDPADAFATAPWLVLSFDMFRRLVDHLPLVSQLIIDELHYVGHSKSLRSKAVRGYVERCARAHEGAGRPTITGLTGTPITAWLQDLWNPLDLLFPGRFGTWWSFTQRYCGGRFEPIVAKNGSPVLDGEGLPRRCWKADGVSNLDELQRRLSHFMLRRTKLDSGIELPPRIRTTIPVNLPQGAKTELRALMRDVRSPSELKRARAGVEAYKIDAAVDLATELRGAGQKVLLFTTRRSHAKALGERLGCPYVTGSDDPGERKAKLLGVGGAPSDVAVATMFSVTTGISLTHFDSCVFVGLDWVPSNILQAEARLHRPGATKTVNVYFLIGKPSIDEHIRKVVVDRLETFSAVLGAKGTANEITLARELEDRSDLIGEIVRMVEETT